MTSGTTITGTTPNRFERTWSGGNGKYETVGGQQRDKWNAYSCTYVHVSGNKDATGTYTLQSNTYLSPGLMSNSNEMKLQTRLVNKIKDHDFDLGKFGAEGGQTISLLTNTMTRLAKSIHELRRGNLWKAADIIGVSGKKLKSRNDVASNWLAIQYGWLPLLSDAHAAGEAFASYANKPRTSVVSASVWQGKGDKFYVVNNLSTGVNYGYHRSSKLIKRIRYEMSEDIPMTRSLGLENPLGIAWEVLPYSFVIDWFLPVGAYLDNLSIIPKLKGRFLTTTVTENHNRSFINVPKGHVYYGAETNIDRIIISRTPSAGLSVVGPQFKPLSEALSPVRFLNAVALASNLVRGPMVDPANRSDQNQILHRQQVVFHRNGGGTYSRRNAV